MSTINEKDERTAQLTNENEKETEKWEGEPL